MPWKFEESYQEFAARHGNDCVLLGTERDGVFYSDHVFMFSDGATVSEDNNASRADPPAPGPLLLKYRRQYVFRKLQIAEQNFLNYRAQCADLAALAQRYVNHNGPPADSPVILKELQEAVLKLRVQLQAIDAQLVDGPAMLEQQRRAAADRDRRARSASVMQEIKQIAI